MARGRRGAVGRSRSDWIGGIAETVIVVGCVLYLFTNELWALLAWEGVAAAYVLVGFAVVWRSTRARPTDRDTARAVILWMWIPPVLAAVVGANSAITALVTRSEGAQDGRGVVLMAAASAGIILSWIMLQIGFAEIYEVIEATGDERGLSFPGRSVPTTLDYLYFSFTLGTSFATSDVEVSGFRARRVVLLHSVAAFFYNALVVAVAFQILQGLINP